MNHHIYLTYDNKIVFSINVNESLDTLKEFMEQIERDLPLLYTRINRDFYWSDYSTQELKEEEYNYITTLAIFK